ncbi:MAG: EamA family transporter [Dehalococcoidia bacterium]|nr:EamA family transporter [Dehalococcoidia bacterium]
MSGRHLLVLAVGVMAISWSAPLIRLADPTPALMLAAFRLSVAAPPMVVLAAGTRRDEFTKLSRRDLLLLTLSGLALAGHFATWVASVQRTSVVTSVVLVTMQPLFVGFGAWIALRERPSNDVIAGAVIAMFGALMLAGDDLGDRGSLEGDVLALLGGVLSGVYLVAGRGARARVSTVTYGAIVFSVAAVALIASVVLAGTEVTGFTSSVYVYALLFGLVPHLVGHNAFNWALGSLPAAVVAIAILGEPVGATVLTAIVLDEVPSGLEWLGAGIVLAGVWVALRRARAPSAAVREPVEL